MNEQTCAVCGQGGYWVAYDTTTDSDRCVNHIGHTPEHPTEPAPELERQPNAPTQNHGNRSE